MKRPTRNILIKVCLAVLLVLQASLSCAVNNVEIAIDSTQILVGQQTALHISAFVKNGQRVVFSAYDPQHELTPGIEVVGTPRTDTVSAEDGFLKVTQHLKLTSFEDTLYYIPPQNVQIDGKDFKTKSLALKVVSVEVDTINTERFYPSKGIQDLPFLWSEWQKAIATAIAVVIFYSLAILACLGLNSGKVMKMKVRIVKHLPPHQVAISEIDKLKDSTKQVSDKDVYTKLTDTLRQYIQARFHFGASEMTSQEIISRLQEDDAEIETEEIKQVFETADFVKFAKYYAKAEENDRNFVYAENFINTTKQDEQPKEERIQPTVTEQEKNKIRTHNILKVVIGISAGITAVGVIYVCWLLYDLRF